MTERDPLDPSRGLALRRAAARLPLDARRALAEGVATDLRIVDTVTTGAALMSFRLRAALSKRAAKAESAAALDGRADGCAG